MRIRESAELPLVEVRDGSRVFIRRSARLDRLRPAQIETSGLIESKPESGG
jgi:hypothetical protein